MATITKEDLKREIGDLIWKMATNLVHGGKELNGRGYKFVRQRRRNYISSKNIRRCRIFSLTL